MIRESGPSRGRLDLDRGPRSHYLMGFPPGWAASRCLSVDASDAISPEDPSVMPRKRFGRNRKNRCRFCTPEGCPRPAYVDYKDVGLLKKLCTNQNKMFSRKRSGSCAAFQRAASSAVKRARFMALLPYVGE